MMEIYDLAATPPFELNTLRNTLVPLRTLADLLDWARQLEPAVTAPAVVTQDEFTHDVLVPHARRWLAFDTS
jgi:hypothetical protein